MVDPPGNETELRSTLTLEEAKVYTAIVWRTVAREPGQYWLLLEEGDGTQPQPSILETYWPYLVGILVVIIVAVFLVIRRMRKRRVIPT